MENRVPGLAGLSVLSGANGLGGRQLVGALGGQRGGEKRRLLGCCACSEGAWCLSTARESRRVSGCVTGL